MKLLFTVRATARSGYKNPRTGQYFAFQRAADYGREIQIGDFLGAGYDQIGQYKAGTWNIIDTRTGSAYADFLGGADRYTPVSGKYLAGSNVTQLGVWNHATQEFVIKPLNCNDCEQRLKWGSNNFEEITGKNDNDDDDIPLRINLKTNGILHRPTTYRQKKGLFKYGIANGQWWIHDPF